jgi:CubicO group peptidase (beta-lactamase class C family)
MKTNLSPHFFPPVLSFFLVVLFSLATVHVHAQQKGYGSASYTMPTSGRYMHDWMIAGPVELGTDHSDDAQQKFFSSDDIKLIAIDPKKPVQPFSHGTSSLAWQWHNSKNDVIDFDGIFKKDFAAAYALAELKSDKEQNVFLSLGSDDGVRVWLNGSLVHDNWIPRGVNADDDLVALKLTKGSNQLLLKVQDISQGWGFMARILDMSGLSDRLAKSVARGNLDEVKMLTEGGADVNVKSKAGLTALHAAKLAGRDDIATYLVSKGAQQTAMPSAAELVDNQFSSLNGKKTAGVAVLVAKDGKVVYSKGFGYGNIEKNEAISAESKFRIGSVTKQFIAAAILRLQEEGKLSVNDKLSKFVSDFPRGNEVTIHHLLTHTSGIHSYTGRNDFLSRVTTAISEDDLVTLIKGDPYDFSPGEQYLYNNSGYFLLGHIIRKVTGKFYGDYLAESFFKPLGMTNTGVYTSDLKLQREALGYRKENDEYKSDINWDMSWAGGAGSLYSTTVDLFKWNEALYNGKVLKPESLRAATTPVVLNNGEKAGMNYGYGLGMGTYRGQDVVSHNGGLHGFSAFLMRFPEENLTIAMLCNTLPPDPAANPNVIAEYYLFEKMDKQTSNSVATVTEDLSAYLGRYDFTNGMVMVVTRENDNLFAQLSGQPRFPIFPSGEGQYFWKVVDAKVRFVKNEKGEVTHGDFTQNGNNLKVMRLQDESVARIDPTLLNDYVGKYDFGNNVEITVTAETGRLFAQATNQPRFEFYPSSDVEFFAKDLNARITFVKDKPGKATKFILDMGGQKKDVTRIE